MAASVSEDIAALFKTKLFLFPARFFTNMVTSATIVCSGKKPRAL